MNAWIASLLAEPSLLRMGHLQRAADANLGLGWIYYALGRALRPTTAVVVGSWRGFVPLILGKALADNVESGTVWFVDPSLADDFWTDPGDVDRHFRRFGVDNVRHLRMTTQEFVTSDAYAALPPPGLVFIDGLHTAEQAAFDWEAFAPRLAPGAVVCFHDSRSEKTSPMYGPDRAYRCSVGTFLATLRARPDLQVFDLPLGPGLTLVRRHP
ncbi:MAG: class I SAM-dependent methyltransferase [bacterium]|nr:class I SAM-dependent methyltransferase [bacterium]